MPRGVSTGGGGTRLVKGVGVMGVLGPALNPSGRPL